MKSVYTKSAAKRIIGTATKIEAVREFKNCIQVTYWCNGGRCSIFLSKKAFIESNAQLRVVGSQQVEIIDVIENDHFIVKSKDNYYIVRPNHFNPRERCECGDCHFRGAKCKHQIAVEQFINQKFSISAA